jgi:hypothetical protein
MLSWIGFIKKMKLRISLTFQTTLMVLSIR